jgi:hypothetical protein
MNSDNPSGAENQQERPAFSHWLDAVPSDVGHYIAGFVEGEGSFNVPIVREYDRGLPWRVTLSFNVSQRGFETPLFLKETLGVGRVRGRGDGVFYYEVTRPDHLAQRIFPFFERFRLRGPKAQDLQIFMKITNLVQSGRHRTPAGIREILALRAPMNRGGKRRRTDDQIIALLRNGDPQRPYAELPFTTKG